MSLMITSPLVVSWGGGTNSTAMLLGMMDRGIVPEMILFADTGGELPGTYQFLETFNRYLMGFGYPGITRVMNSGIYKSLEDNCLVKKMLPSKAYGFSSCSDKYKIRPQEGMLKHWAPAVEVWRAGGKVTKAIGIDAGEAHRARIQADEKYRYIYPLVEWDWGRDECVARIADAGLPQPGKSACFFCPSARKAEIRALHREHPDLFARAVAMEENAELKTVRGLGRGFSWGTYIKADGAQGRLFPEVPTEPCVACYDGG